MALAQSIGIPRVLDDGQTAAQQANQFVKISTAGARDLVERFLEVSNAASSRTTLRKIVKRAAQPIRDEYEARARSHEATGNLAASVDDKTVNYEFAAVCVVGPRQTGPVGSTPDARSGNHAWLVEFGTDRRKPGTRGRIAYINVHQSINRRMRKSGGFNNRQFEQMGRGYYFLMGSINGKTANGIGKSGYPRDFAMGKGRSEQHPITLSPGDTIAPMKELGLMKKTISSTSASVLALLRSQLEAEINARGG
jgi:hypothetical protein